MRLTKQHNFKDFDLAYAYESKARAYAAIGESEKMKKCFLNAKDSGEKIVGDDDRKLFFDDLYKDFQIERVDARRSINSNPEKRGKLKELLISNQSNRQEYVR